MVRNASSFDSSADSSPVVTQPPGASIFVHLAENLDSHVAMQVGSVGCPFLNALESHFVLHARVLPTAISLDAAHVCAGVARAATRAGAATMRTAAIPSVRCMRPPFALPTSSRRPPP